MLEMAADRLVLVDGGTAREFDGTMDDYVAFILGQGTGKGSAANDDAKRSEEHTSELQSLMRSSYAVLCLEKKNIPTPFTDTNSFLSLLVDKQKSPLCKQNPEQYNR